jgi:hypothetical protein
MVQVLLLASLTLFNVFLNDLAIETVGNTNQNLFGPESLTRMYGIVCYGVQ